MPTTLQVQVYGNRIEHLVTFPCRWDICPHCDGNAVTTAHIECDGGGFTADEWAEACGDDPDFADDYFGGRYDRPCPHCDGLGRIKVIAADLIRGWRQTILYRAYLAQLKDDAEYEAMCAMERRMGC